MNFPIWGMPLAVFDGPRTGTPAASARGIGGERLLGQGRADDKEYQDTHPGIEISHETVAGTGAATYPDVIRTGMAGGYPPDLFFMWGGSLAAPFIDAGGILPLDDKYQQRGWDKLFFPWVSRRRSSGRRRPGASRRRPRHGLLVPQGPVREGRHRRPADVRRVRGEQREAEGGRHRPDHDRRQVRLEHDAPARLPHRDRGRAGAALPSSVRSRRAGTARRSSTPTSCSRTGSTRGGSCPAS